MISQLPGVRSPARCSWVRGSDSHTAEIQMWGPGTGSSTKSLTYHDVALVVWGGDAAPRDTVLRHCWTLCHTLTSLCSRRGPGQGWRVTAEQRPLHRGTSLPIPGRGCSGLCGEGVGQGWGQPGRCGSQAPGPLSILPSDLT